MKTCENCIRSTKGGHQCSLKGKTSPHHTACERYRAKIDDGPCVPPILDFETNVMYVLLRAAAHLVYDIDKRLKTAKMCFSKTKARQIACLNKYVDDLKSEFEKLEKDYTNNLIGSEYDIMIRDALETLRLVLYYGDRCGSSAENRDKIFELLKSMPSAGIISEEDINRFNMR